ncbi:MAG TPA: phosphoribosylaminoimidazolesuccinocarboxamide synthase [Roseiflexaceae bacterium]|nr:phosphoribosylaminoimidazolesuccinocarboxamide synthase [Roseiflexaceae bacterium]
MNLGAKLAEGKTKVVYAHPDNPQLAVLTHKDGISAGDGARRNVIGGKGALSGRTTANVFALLNRHGIPTHYIDSPEPTVMLVRRCAMVPVEVVMRRMATGSFLRRHPETAEGTRFEPPLVEFFLKDDAQHDPQISAEELVAQGIASAEDVQVMVAAGQMVFSVLEHAWADQDVALVDLKIEFGRPADASLPLLVADVIDNDSWRIWPGGDKARMLDKQVYRNMAEVTEGGLEEVRQRYEAVAAMTDRWRSAT